MKDNKLKIDSGEYCDAHHSKITQISDKYAIDRLSGLQVFTRFQGNMLIKLLSIVILLALTTLLVATITTLHLHITADNQIYVHSHPMETSGKSGKHSHSQNEYIFFNFIKSLLHKILIVTIVVIIFLHIYRRPIKQQTMGFAYSGYYSLYQYRAPPIFLLN